MMPQKTRFMCAMGASALGTLCFVAVQPGFALLSEGAAKFVGMAFFLVGGLFWTLFGIGAGKNRNGDKRL